MGFFNELATLAVGFVLGIALDWSLKGRIVNHLERFSLRRQLRKSLPETDTGVALGRRTTDTDLIEGNGYIAIRPEDIHIYYEDRYIRLPSRVDSEVEQISRAEGDKEARGARHAWNGDCATIVEFNNFHRSTDESPGLSMRVAKAHYFEFLATQARAEAGFRELGWQSEARREVVGDFADWAESPSPNQVNGLPLNLFVTTEDDFILFARRSQSVAVAPGVLSATVNENLNLELDRLPHAREFDFGGWVARAIEEELGWTAEQDNRATAASSAPLRAVDRTTILGFSIHTGCAAYGIVGYTRLPRLAAEVRASWAKSARDRGEISELVPVRLKLDDVTAFIHENGLYDSVGLAACLSLIHHTSGHWKVESVTWSRLTERFVTLQEKDT